MVEPKQSDDEEKREIKADAVNVANKGLTAKDNNYPETGFWAFVEFFLVEF